ncbi:MAG: choice-of-anchor Q domain-containing protein [Methylococcales bacterium]
MKEIANVPRHPPRHARSAGFSLLLAGNVPVNVFNVTTNSDSGTDSLRDAIDLANMAAGADQIAFDRGLGTTIQVDASFSLFGDAAAEVNGLNANNIFSDIPDLAALADNGCATPAGFPAAAACVQTHALKPASPALDTGANPLVLAADQRGVGFGRSLGPQTDIGAFEIFAPSLPRLALSPDPIDFGDILVGSSSATISVMVSNPGSPNLTVSAVDAPALPFASVAEGTCGTPRSWLHRAIVARWTTSFHPQSSTLPFKL